MKKILVFLLASLLLTACGTLNEDADADINNEDREEAEEEVEMLKTVYKIDGAAPTDQQMSEMVSTLQKRLDDSIKHSSVKAKGTDQIVIEIPDTEDAVEDLSGLLVHGELRFMDEAGNVVLTGEHIKEASAVSNSTDSALTYDSSKEDGDFFHASESYNVNITLTEEGTSLFAEATEQNVGKQISIYLDDTLIQSAQVLEPITGGKCVITNFASIDEAERLAAILRSGSLPLDLIIAE